MPPRARELNLICQLAVRSELDLASALAVACGQSRGEVERHFAYCLTRELRFGERPGFAHDLASVLWPDLVRS